MKKKVSRKKISVKAGPPATSKHFPIVAIGTSAGGLEAVSELFKHLSPDTGMAFLYLQHLSPQHKSMLDSLLSKTTSMKVQEAENKAAMLPNHVYIIPPDKEMNISDGIIKLSPRPRSPKTNFPIDILFSSLAEAHKENVIGVILSGGASDGTRGMITIKQAGGLTFAQDSSAKFGSMPINAVSAGAVDFILSPKEIAQEISRLSKHPFIKPNGKATQPIVEKADGIDNNNPDLKKILNFLHQAHGVDFSQYKMTTIKRRILRRMLLYRIKSLREYVNLLISKSDEPDILYQDLLINVASFFRASEMQQRMDAEKKMANLFHFIADAMPQKVWTADAKGHRNYFNKQWVVYTGMSLNELANDGWQRIIHPDDLPNTSRVWKQSMKTGTVFEVEDRKRDRNGQYKWHLSRAIPYKDQSGKITMWIGTNTEMEKQKTKSLELESTALMRSIELAEEKDFSETIINTTIDLIVVYDKNLRIISFNKASEAFFGMKKEEVIGKTLTKIFPKAIGTQGEKDLRRSLQGEFIHNRMFLSPVTGRYYENFLTPLKNTKGEIYACVVIAHDITDSIEALQTLELSEEKFSKLFESSPYSISLTEIETGKIVEVNESYLELTGFTRQELIGNTTIELKIISKEEHDAIYKVLSEQGRIKNAEVSMRIKTGEIVPVLVSTETITVGQQKYFLHALNDITELKKSEKEIEQKNKDLEKMNKELEAFTYISSHDLQEPLRKIQTFATRLLDVENQNLSETGKDYFHRMQEAANKMQTLIQDLLSFSRINSSERKFELVDLGSMIGEIKSEFKETIAKTNARIEIGEMLQAKVIPFQFRQVIFNLLSNALKFSQSGTPPHIEIYCTFIPAHSTYILKGIAMHHIVFRDNGIGFEQRFAEQIFQLFQRLHGKDEYGGTGIGLAIVKKIIENHNGIIFANSEIGKGARFDMYIPAEPAAV